MSVCNVGLSGFWVWEERWCLWVCVDAGNFFFLFWNAWANLMNKRMSVETDAHAYSKQLPFTWEEVVWMKEWAQKDDVIQVQNMNIKKKKKNINSTNNNNNNTIWSGNKRNVCVSFWSKAKHKNKFSCYYLNLCMLWSIFVFISFSLIRFIGLFLSVRFLSRWVVCVSKSMWVRIR